MKTASLKPLLFTLFVVLLTVEVAHAQLKLPFRSSRTSTSQTPGLTQTDGPWLIMCASFVGEQGEKQARLLASTAATTAASTNSNNPRPNWVTPPFAVFNLTEVRRTSSLPENVVVITALQMGWIGNVGLTRQGPSWPLSQVRV